MITSYHNHTRWSDGSATVADLVAAAGPAGVDEAGVSDHLVLHPDGPQFDWRLSPERLAEYVDDVRAAAARAPVPVRLGIEADFFPSTVATLEGILAAYPFDYVIGSVHFVDGFSVDGGAGPWEALSPGDRDRVWDRYWQAIRSMAESRVFDIGAHLDLPKRFGYRPTREMTGNAAAALDAIAAAGMAVEINTAGWYLPAREAYPSPPLLEAARARGIPVMINADAHRPEHVARGFDRARDLARSAGYSSFVRYEGRRMIPVAD